MKKQHLLLGIFALTVVFVARSEGSQRSDPPPAPMMMLALASESPAAEAPTVAKESHATEIAVYLVKLGQPLAAAEASGVSVRVDFFADEAGSSPVGPFVILQPLPGTSVYRATLPAVDDGAVKSAKITLIRSEDGPHEEILPTVYPMTEGRLKAEIDVPGV